jgi:hypothetical protein
MSTTWTSPGDQTGLDRQRLSSSPLSVFFSGRRLSAGAGCAWPGAHWCGAHYRPGPARLCPPRGWRQVRWRAGRPGQRARRGWPGHGGRLGRGGRRVWCSPSCGHVGRGGIKPDEGSGRGRCRVGCTRPAAETMTEQRQARHPLYSALPLSPLRREGIHRTETSSLRGMCAFPGHDGLHKYPGPLAIVPRRPVMAGTLTTW